MSYNSRPLVTVKVDFGRGDWLVTISGLDQSLEAVSKVSLMLPEAVGEALGVGDLAGAEVAVFLISALAVGAMVAVASLVAAGALVSVGCAWVGVFSTTTSVWVAAGSVGVGVGWLPGIDTALQANEARQRITINRSRRCFMWNSPFRALHANVRQE